MHIDALHLHAHIYAGKCRASQLAECTQNCQQMLPVGRDNEVYIVNGRFLTIYMYTLLKYFISYIHSFQSKFMWN